MIRKTLFITVSIFQIDLYSKAVILISITFISLFMIITCRPFILNELNILEFRSNVSAIITLYSGTLYMNTLSKEFKGILLSLIVLTNIIFFLNFLLDIFSLFLVNNFEKIHKSCPSLISAIVSVQKMISGIMHNILKRTGIKIPFSQSMQHYQNKRTQSMNFDIRKKYIFT